MKPAKELQQTSTDDQASKGSSEVALDVSGVSKRFGSLVANEDIDLRVHKGEIVALLGENGAGKTTLMNILYGHYVPNEGTVEAFGRPLKHGSPHAALEAGIGMVHQHFTLAENLSVLDNIVLGTQPIYHARLDRAGAERKLRGLMEETGLRVDPNAVVGDLTVGEAQRVEILKALYRGVGLLILDEPTAVLTPQESEELFSTVRSLVVNGLAVIFISHKLKEVMAVSTRCVVLRAGRVVGDVVTAEASAELLASMMVGEEITKSERPTPQFGPASLEIRELVVQEKGRRLLDDCDLRIHKGEVVAVAGVAGNGQNTLFEVLAGLRTPETGTVELDGHSIAELSPREAVQRGIARIPEDRNATGLLVDSSIWENVIAERYRTSTFSRRGFLRHRSALMHTRELIRAYDVKCPGPHAVARTLSGGNMQKILLGRTLWWSPTLIVASQPTRGLDVGAVQFVHERLFEARAKGAAILVISEDLDEILSIADSIVVMSGGRISDPVSPNDVSIQTLGLMMTGEL